MKKKQPNRSKRPAPPGVSNGQDIAAMIRVDHAGEYGAVRIYEGQLAVLGARKSKTAAAINVRVQWPGTVAYAVSTSKALGAYYK